MRIAIVFLFLYPGCSVVDDTVGVASKDLTSCPTGNGLYCATGVGLSPQDDTLYRCTNGQLTVEATCFAGCQTEPPGVNDQCRPGVCPDGDGLYCGLGGFAGCSISHRCLDVNTLYDCRAGAWTVVHQCASGCSQQPPGQPDDCVRGGESAACTADADCEAGLHCVSGQGGYRFCHNSCPYGDGLYCGVHNDSPDGPPDDLFRCVNGVRQFVTHCKNGCDHEPPGVPDRCNP